MNETFKTYPLKSINIDEAKKIQFKIVEAISNNLTGLDILSRGDLGVKQPNNIPDITRKVEKTLSDIFETEDAILVSGSGTGALRWSIGFTRSANDKILVHDAPIYPTTLSTLNQFKITPIFVDFNDINKVKEIIKSNPDIDQALVQYTRQKIDDSYSYEEVIKTIKEANSNIKIVTDDNYAVFKTGNIGIDFGADLSTFSTFKLLGPEGVGAIIGKKDIIDSIRKQNYSGGSQIQGWQALEVLRGITYAPVMLAIQAETIDNFYKNIKNEKISEIKDVYIVNAQSKVIIVEFHKNIAKKFLKLASKHGMLPHPVGAESKYEITPLFYRVSGTFRKYDKTLSDRMIRINPNRAGDKLIINVIKKILKEM